MADKFTRDWNHDRHKGIRMGTLWCARGDVDGDITLSPQFLAESAMARLDMLGDFIGLLNREYEATSKELLMEWEAARVEAELKRRMGA